MIIQNAYVYTEGNGFRKKDIYIRRDRFCKEREIDDASVINAEGCYAIPGLIDMHLHGCVGWDFCAGTWEALDGIAAYEASIGVTATVNATMTLDEKQLQGILKTADQYMEKQTMLTGRARLLGVYLEGPFVSASRSGAQDPAYVRKPDQALFNALQKDQMIKVVAIAPETEGAIEFCERNRDKVILSLAHTDADYETAMRAFEAGASQVTHLYNAMTPFGHRQPGVVGAAMDAGAWTELICDGIHVHPAAVRAAFRLMGEDRIIFISDSMMAAGLSDGDYSLGSQAVTVRGKEARLKDGTLAGSAMNLMECVQTAVQKMGIPLETAVRCAAVNPARRLGIYQERGSIQPGKVADVVLLNREDLSLQKVIMRGISLS